MNAVITVTTNGWFDSLPGATQDYVRRLVVKAQDQRGWTVRFTASEKRLDAWRLAQARST